MSVVDRWRALNDGAQQAIQSFANALFLTPVFVLLLLSWATPTPRTMLVAVAVGVLTGLAWFLWSDGRDFSYIGTGQSILLAGAFVVLSFVLVMLVLPDGSMPVLIVGVLGFNWAMALSGLFRHVL